MSLTSCLLVISSSPVIGPMTVMSSANLITVVGAVDGHAVVHEQEVQEKAEHAVLRVAVLRLRVEDEVVPICTAWGLHVRTLSVECRVSELDDDFGGY